MLPEFAARRIRPAVSGLPPTFWYLFGGIFVNRIGNFVTPFLSLFLTRERGFSIADAGLTVAAYAVGGMVANLAGGALSDRFGRRPTLLFSLLVGPLFLVALPFAESHGAIMALSFVVGGVYELYRPAALAAVADVVPLADRRRAFALHYWVVNVGFSIGLSLAGFLADRGIHLLFFADATTTFLYGLVVLWKVPETRPAHLVRRAWLLGSGAPFRHGAFAAFLLLTFALAGVFNLNHSMLPIEVVRNGLSPGAYGPLIAINGVLIVLFQPFMGVFTQRFYTARVLAVSAVVLGIGYGATAFVSTAAGYAATIAVWTFAEMAWLPLGPAIVSQLAPDDLRGTYQGAYGMAWAFAASVSPAVGGLVLDGFGSEALWLGALAIALVVSVGFARLGPVLREPRRDT